jgi:prephenate dehydrogenase
LRPVQKKRITIIGVGLLGGSIGLAMKAAGIDWEIVAYGHRRATLDTALELGAIDRAEDSAESSVRGADWVVLCTPVGLLAELLNRIGPQLKDGAIVTDVGSTKRSVVRAAEGLKPAARFVGSHPMAGSEKRGVEFARADLFQNARCILTPTQRTDQPALDEVEHFWQALGMKTVRMSPEDHDRLTADISHLPHALAAALVAMQHDEALPLAGAGFLDTTRVAGGDGGLWRDILQDNRDNVAQSIQRLQGKLQELSMMLQPAEGDRLKAWLDAAAHRRAKLLAEKLKELHAG